MTIKVELDQLPDAVSGLPGAVFLLTTNDDLSPHPANVPVSFDDGEFTLSAGGRSCRNCADRPTVTLLWPNEGSKAMSLLVDGVAEVIDAEAGKVVLRPTSAIWHGRPQVP